MNQLHKEQFVWRLAYSHVIAYFIAGLFAVTFMNYRGEYANGALALLMLPVDTPIVALGPALQIFRGLLIGLVLFPLCEVIIGNRGTLKLALLVAGLSAISTIGAAPGSFEGFIYTKIPATTQLIGLPETALYIALFCLIFWVSNRLNKRWVSVVAVITVVLIVLMSVAGYLSLSGVLPKAGA